MGTKRIVVLISGRGSNMEALVRAAIPGATIAAVISNRPQAAGLTFAQQQGIATEVVDHTAYAERAAFDAALQERIDCYEPDLVVLAGFMRILGEDFVRHYKWRLMNIHPSLLPLFPGLNTHARAIAAGCRLHGATVHFVTAALDHGPIIIQAAVPILPMDTPERLAARVLRLEHHIYPQAVRWFVEERLEILPDGRVVVADASFAEESLVVPALEPGGQP